MSTEVREAGHYYSEQATDVFENTEDKVVSTLRRFVDRLDSAVDSLSSSS